MEEKQEGYVVVEATQRPFENLLRDLFEDPFDDFENNFEQLIKVDDKIDLLRSTFVIPSDSAVMVAAGSWNIIRQGQRFFVKNRANIIITKIRFLREGELEKIK